jgi:hypothetical protein
MLRPWMFRMVLDVSCEPQKKIDLVQLESHVFDAILIGPFAPPWCLAQRVAFIMVMRFETCQSISRAYNKYILKVAATRKGRKCVNFSEAIWAYEI